MKYEVERAPGIVVPLVRDVRPAVLKRRPALGKWSVHEHAYHLALHDFFHAYRIEALLLKKEWAPE